MCFDFFPNVNYQRIEEKRLFLSLLVCAITIIAMTYYAQLETHSLSKYSFKPNVQRVADKGRIQLEETFLTYWDPIDEQKVFDYGSKKASKTKKRVLVTFVNAPFWSRLAINNKTLSKCRQTECVVSYGTQLIPYSDALVFHGVDINGSPPSRPIGQPWVLFNMESPVHTGRGMGRPGWRNAFNWTMTYRIDSDFFTPYSLLVPRLRAPSYEYLLKVVKNKTKSTAWLVSHCGTSSRRSEYVKRLQKTVDVDIYGLCGPNKCQDNCYSMLNSTYKFYLSFENSLCRNYVTEKLFKMFDAHIIPIVRGGSNYTSMVPKGSYINTEDYKSPEDLGEYLKYLSNNTTAYMEILMKKTPFRSLHPRIVQQRSFCQLCERLVEPNPFRKNYEDVSVWFFNNACHKPADL